MQLQKILVLVVTSYPYGFGEPFLEAELKVVAEYFDKIYIVIPEREKIDKNLCRYSMPANAEVILINVKSSLPEKILSLFSIFTTRILRHLIVLSKRPDLKFNLKILKILFAYEAKDRVFRSLLLKELKSRNINFNNLWLYTYWFTEYTYSIARIKARYPEIKAFSRAHGWDIYFERHDPPYLPLRSYIINHLDRVITISENGRNYLLKKISNISSDKIVTHRLGTGAGELLHYHPNGNKVSLLSLAFITPVKHLELLIDGLIEFKNISVEWHHIGGGDDYAEAIKLYANNVLNDNPNISFTFHGTMDANEITSFLKGKKIDLIVNTSHSEGLPVSLMEAMAFSIPAIAPDIGGISEIIEDGKNGFIMSSHPSPLEIAETIEKYLKLDFNAKNRLKENAYKTWVTKFNSTTNHRRFAEELMCLGTTPYQVCKRCILDSADDPSITFNEEGICIMCEIYDNAVKRDVLRGEAGRLEIEKMVTAVKQAGKNKKYDIIIGLSGGVDSTYVAWIVKNLGLRALAIHLDNGWDSELAVKNIENVVRRLDIDLYTHVINWVEFRDLQLSYFKAGVIDLEIPTDHAIMAILYRTAREHRVKYILSGHNLVTEGFLPEGWIHHKFDVRNLRAIHRKFGTEKLKSYPMLPFFVKIIYEKIFRIKVVSLLNYIDFDKNEAKRLMKEKLDWRDYGSKHYESVFTRFYQAYILPKKFKADKRKSHYSTLICSGQLTREEALKMMKEEAYPDKNTMQSDRLYVIKKLGFTEESFGEYMKAPIKKHNDYPSYMNIYFRLRPVIRLLKKVVPAKWI